MNKFVPIGVNFIVFLFVVVSLAYIPGSAAVSTKYVNKNDGSDLTLSNVAIPVSLLSFSLLLLLGSMFLMYKI